jgi:hypothetical protein
MSIASASLILPSVNHRIRKGTRAVVQGSGFLSCRLGSERCYPGMAVWPVRHKRPSRGRVVGCKPKTKERELQMRCAPTLVLLVVSAVFFDGSRGCR